MRVEILLENYHDTLLARRGYLATDAVRRERVRVLADSGCTMLVLPQDLVERLGLELSGEKVIVTYADERREERPVAGLVTVRVGDRSMQTDCVVAPPLSEPLLGQIILERLDLLVDCREGKLVPRPESPYLPSLKMKAAAPARRGHGESRSGKTARGKHQSIL
ncbi:MAG: aspartyl protease family protein [Desulfotomaculales bacterium]